MSDHGKDSDCTIDPETDCCTECGVWHADPCPDCGGRGFHNDGCFRSDRALPLLQGANL